jgi:hypothetical protein
MKTFKSYLAEYAPTSTSDIIFVGSPDAVEDAQTLMIPIYSSMFKRIFPDTIRTTVFHVTSAENLEGLKKLEGKKKSISAFFKMSANELEDGIASDGGVVAELDGDILVSSGTDINTAVDKTGRRWAPLVFLMVSELKSPQMKSVFKDLDKLIASLIAKHTSFNRKTPYVYWAKMKSEINDNKKLNLLIKDYFNGIETVFKKHSAIIGKALYGYAKNSKLTDDAWDEQVVNNIKIKKIHILPDELDDEDMDDIKTLVKTHRIPMESWDDSSALQLHIAGITRK